MTSDWGAGQSERWLIIKGWTDDAVIVQRDVIEMKHDRICGLKMIKRWILQQNVM